MVILASASPRRQELIKQITTDFTIITADIDEDKSYVLSPLNAVLDIAKRKGEKIHKDHYDDLVISAVIIVKSLVICLINSCLLGEALANMTIL